MISFNSIPGDVRVPLFYAEMDNSQANSGATQLRRLIIAPANDDSAAESELVIATQESVVRALAGLGSPLAEAYSTWRRSDPMGEVWVLPVVLDEGVAAAGKVTVTGAATESGVLSFYVGDERVQVTVSSGMTAADVGAALALAINAKGLCLKAQAAAEGSADLALTATFKGLLGNDIRIGVNLRGSAGGERTPAGLVLALTQPTGGAGVPDVEALLAKVGDAEFEFVFHPFTDTASLDSFRLWMDDNSGRWSWGKMLYGHVYTARRGTIGELVTAGRLRNDQHHTMHGFEVQTSAPAWKVGAAYAARQAVFITADPARPTQTGELVGIAPPAEGKRFLLVERQSLLWAGIATAYCTVDGVRIERAVTTYQRNAYGQPDDSYLDSETMHLSAYIIRFLKGRITSKFGRHKLADDGTRFGAGQAIVTPSILRNELIAAYGELELEGKVENAEAFREHLIVERDSQNPNRVNILFPPDYVNQLRVVALLNQFRQQYPQSA
ncbi:phage tail sheath subtilisin-like domain-containing protein [Bordetella bronchiseptica]|uniref:phage tail sheath subtilisin-like domain-containing protein n=1 Tax=Bordetella bronchiseptica TaxID=518 RepID=UPI000460F4AF|nr:phage tail sheath subtilisin-like domain-containing protein [Bordetella bronchiseptica]KDD50175.1 phage tail sheath protein [Bordetella bronchiseptica MBORD901]